MNKLKTILSNYLQGTKSLVSRNIIICICLNIVNTYGNQMKNAVRTLVGQQSLGLTPSVIGMAVSLFTLFGLLGRTPSGAIVDKLRHRLKYILAGAFLIRVLCWTAFGFVKDAVGYTVFFVIDGLIWSFIGTFLPAFMALAADRRVVGSGYAVMTAITQLVCSSARQVSITMYQNSGLIYSMGIAAGVSLLGVILSLLIDGEKLVAVSDQNIPRKKGFSLKDGLSGINVKMLPLAICQSIGIIVYAADRDFFQLYMANEGVPYLDMVTLGKTILSVVALITGILCDLIHPKYIIYTALLGQGISCLLWSSTSSELLRAGALVYQSTFFFSSAFRTFGSRCISKKEQGSLFSTLNVSDDIATLLGSAVLGVLIDLIGYRTSFRALGILVLADIILFFFVAKKYDQNALRED